MKKKKKNPGLGMITAALIFLFNPNITVVDVLPDCIGYALLCAALSQLGDLHESIGGAVALFRKMILVDAAKLVAILWVFGMTVASERSSSILLWTFVFGTVEMIVLIPAYGKLFHGINEMGYYYPNTVILESTETGKGKSRTDRMRSLTFAFIAVKAILPILPELADLTNGAYDETSMTSMTNLYRYIGLMRAMAFVPVLIVGIVWLCRMARYFARLRRDEALMESLQAQYDQRIRPKVGLFVERNFRTVCVLLILALALTMDFRIDDQNYLPDFLAAIAFGVTFVFLTKGTKRRAWLGAVIPYFLLSLAASAVEAYFFDHYRYGLLIKNDTAMLTYVIMTAANALRGMAFLAVVAMLLRELRGVVREHTGYVVGREYHNNNEEKMIAALHGDLNRNLFWAGIGALAYVIADVCYDLLIPNVPFFTVIPTVFGILCVGLFARALWAIRDAVHTKYMLE